MAHHDRDSDTGFEEFLNEFELRRPNAFPKFATRAALMRRVASAAGILVGCGISMWVLSRTPFESRKSATPTIVADDIGNSRRASTVVLTRLAFEDPETFEAELCAASRNSLPNFQRKDSALQALAKE
jgi:hypothetical protein